MKLISYTITLDEMHRDFEELRCINYDALKDIIENSGENLVKEREWLRARVDDITADYKKLSLEQKIDIWLRNEYFADQIFTHNRDVSDILLIVSTKDGDTIEKHWLCSSTFRVGEK